MTYTSAEKEAIGLCIALEAVKDLANNAMLDVRDIPSYPGEVQVYFPTHEHKDLFIIRFLDFVKEGGDQKLTGVSGSCLNVLKESCNSCSFDQNDSVATLTGAVKRLDHWLNFKAPMKLWLPTLDLEANVEVSRLDLVAISGNHCKHNLSRLTGISKHIHSILERSGYSVPIEQIPLALDDFREHLQEDYFIYYGTWISELTNNICWGIQDYLYPTFESCIVRYDQDGIRRYRYEYPTEIRNEIPRQWFWRLMNNILSGPNIKRFSALRYLKEKSSLERYNK